MLVLVCIARILSMQRRLLWLPLLLWLENGKSIFELNSKHLQWNWDYFAYNRHLIQTDSWMFFIQHFYSFHNCFTFVCLKELVWFCIFDLKTLGSLILSVLYVLSIIFFFFLLMSSHQLNYCCYCYKRYAGCFEDLNTLHQQFIYETNSCEHAFNAGWWCNRIFATFLPNVHKVLML